MPYIYSYLFFKKYPCFKTRSKSKKVIVQIESSKFFKITIIEIFYKRSAYGIH